MLTKDEKTLPLDEIVPEYHSSFFLVRNFFRDRIKYALAFAPIDDKKKIMDLGCGSGLLLQEIRKINGKCKLVGVDFNINLKNLKVENCELKEDDATKLSFKDNSFDIVFALDSLEHIKNVDDAIKQLRRVLKPNGTFIITGPTENFFYKFGRFLLKGTFSEKEGPGTGVHYHTIRTLDKDLIKHGFVKKKEMNLPQYLPGIIIEKVISYTNKK